MNDLQRVINFSGGKTSAYMTITNYKDGDIVLFTDTGREHDKTYKFINDFEAFEGIPVTRVSYLDSPKPFDAMLTRKNYRQIPNRVKRMCTVELKINTAKRYLKTLGVIRFENLLGFRFDEPKRVIGRTGKYKKVIDKFPLYDAGITKAMVNEYWQNKPYTLEIPAILGNCTLCFLKGKNAIMSILATYPELAEPWIRDENEAQKHGKGGGHTYFENVTIEQLRSIAQNNLFRDYDLDQVSAAYQCACTT